MQTIQEKPIRSTWMRSQGMRLLCASATAESYDYFADKPIKRDDADEKNELQKRRWNFLRKRRFFYTSVCSSSNQGGTGPNLIH